VTVVERTRQQLDPSGSTGVASVTVFLSLGAFLYALVMMLRSESQISHPVFAVLALALLAIAEAIVMWGSMPNHAPFTGRVHAAAHGVALAAIACEAIGQWGTNTHIRDDWGPVTLGIILVALGPYRPAREIAASGIASALAIGVLTFSEVPSLVTPGPPLAFVVVAITPLLALCFSAAMFSDGVVASIEQWQKRAKVASVGLVREFWEGIARSVQQDRVTILNRDVLPFFSEVLARDEVTDDDRARAREIAEAIRRVMVEEVDRSWLEVLVEHTGAEHSNRPGAAQAVIDDPHRVATGMNTVQRTAIRALLVAFADIPDFTRKDLRILLTDRGRQCDALIAAQLPRTDFVMRSTFAPFLAVMRAVFTDLEVDFVQRELTLRFSYEHN
jgi:hypothetical protein